MKVNIEIIDKRIQKEFNLISFSKYKKTDVKKQLIKSINNNKVEETNYWCAELLCAGHFLDLWEIIFEILSKNIYLANPKLPIYIETRVETFKNILLNGYIDNELKMRNNQKVRDIFAEIFTILCFSKKKQTYNYIKIDKKDFNLLELSHRLKAVSLEYVNNIFLKNDPKELYIPINELCYNLTIKNTLLSCYWLEWILEYEKNCKKKKEKCICNSRNIVNINVKDKNDVIWLLWDCLLKQANNNSLIISKIINSLLRIFTLHYSTSIKNKRKHLLYFSIYLITDDINTNKSMIDDKNAIYKVVNNIDKIYNNIKKNELVPETNYLFNGLKTDNKTKSLNKLDALNSFGFIPRN
jgi:hypothetical protein